MDFNISNNNIIVTQQQYIKDQFNNYNTKVNTPMSSTTNLRTAIPNGNNESLLPICGKLRYLADRCRPDILVTTGEISTGGANNPSDQHVKVAKRTMNYLYNTMNMGVQFNNETNLHIFGYCDASHIMEGNSKSRLGGCLFLGYNSGAILSFSRNDTTAITRDITTTTSTTSTDNNDNNNNNNNNEYNDNNNNETETENNNETETENNNKTKTSNMSN